MRKTASLSYIKRKLLSFLCFASLPGVYCTSQHHPVLLVLLLARAGGAGREGAVGGRPTPGGRGADGRTRQQHRLHIYKLQQVQKKKQGGQMVGRNLAYFPFLTRSKALPGAEEGGDSVSSTK